MSESAPSLTPSESPVPYASLTLSRLPPARLPEPTSCKNCHASLWHATAEDVRCFCRAMRLISYSSASPELLTDCDGLSFPAAEQ